MESTIKTYKKEMNYKEMLDEIYPLRRAIDKVKQKVIKGSPYLKEDINQIPNAGIFVHNKLNEFIKELSNKLKSNKSVIYAAVKNELVSMTIADNLNDILGYEFNVHAKTNKLQVMTKPTVWQKIKRFINQKLFNIYVTDEDFTRIDNYINEKNRIRRELTNEAITRAERINEVKLDKEFISTAVLDYLQKMYDEKDFSPEIFKSEIGQELKILGIPDMTKEIDDKIKENVSFIESIRVKQETINNVEYNCSSEIEKQNIRDERTN